ncbi:MAG: hypothetical protein ACI4HI_06110 [Lachnospiraceae bacterium]
MRKNGKIECFRFIYCITIILFHCQKQFLQIDRSTMHFAFFPRGYMGVEFFYLVTGFLMAKTIHKSLQNTEVQADIGEETFHFMVRKIKAILPYHLIAFGCLFVANIFLNHWSLKLIIKNFMNYFPNLLLIQKLGYGVANLNHVEWYISCMIFACMILYPICRKYYSMFVRVIAPVGGLMILGYFSHEFGTFAAGAGRWTGVCCAYLLRAMAEIALGAAAYEFALYLSKQNLTRRQRAGLTGLEVVCYILPLLFCISTVRACYEIIFFLAMWVSIATSFSGQTYGNEFFNNKFFYFLGSSSLILYLNQVLGLNISKNLPLTSFAAQTAVVLCVTVTASAISKAVVTFGKNAIAQRTNREK